MNPRDWAMAIFIAMALAFAAGAYTGMVVANERREFAALDAAQAVQGCNICFTDACLGEVFGEDGDLAHHEGKEGL